VPKSWLIVDIAITGMYNCYSNKGNHHDTT
jgi:hypothetical protein